MKTYANVPIEKLNEAYTALEKMRKLNLQVECDELGVPVDEHKLSGHCKHCLLATHTSKPTFPRITRLMNHIVEESKTDDSRLRHFPRIRKLVQNSPTSPSCLVCGNPACRNHAAGSVLKGTSAHMCQTCEELFAMDFIVDCLTKTGAERQALIDRMVDMYDRALLLLYFTSHYADSVCKSLENSAALENQVGIGSSATGVVSGALGIAAAATILTPAGAPLLIASLVFGGTSTVVQTGTEAVHYYSDANQLANKIMALHGILLQILNVVSVLRDALVRDHIRSDYYSRDGADLAKTLELHWPQTRTPIVSGLTLGRYGLAGVEITSQLATAGETATLAARTGTNVVRGLRFARFAGGALSAAIVVLEARSIQTRLKSIMAGNPCEKAETLRKILAELEQLPDTALLDRECSRYLQVMEQRSRAMTVDEVTKILVEQAQAAVNEEEKIKRTEEEATNKAEEQQKAPEVKENKDELNEQETSVLIVDGEDDFKVKGSSRKSAESGLSMSLLERITLHKQLQRGTSVDSVAPDEKNKERTVSVTPTGVADDKANCEEEEEPAILPVNNMPLPQVAAQQDVEPVIQSEEEGKRFAMADC